MTGGQISAFVAIGAAAALLTACGSTPAGGSAAATPGDARSLPAPRSVPAGFRWLHSDRAGMDVAVPKEWLSVSADDIAAKADNVKEFADRFGLTVDEAKQAVTSGLEVVVRAPESTTEVRLLVFDRIVTPAVLQKTLEAGGSTNVLVEPYPSPTGFNVIAQYDFPAPSGPLACRAMLAFLKNPGKRTAMIQACSDDAHTTEDLATTVFQGTRFS